jgi:hypothetical protein
MNKNEFSQAIQFLESLNAPYYIHAGFGMHLNGLLSDLDDLDVRIDHPNLEKVLKQAEQSFAYPAILTIGGEYDNGQYRFGRIEIETPTPIDICSSMGVINAWGTVDFPPFALSARNSTIANYQGVPARVAPPEVLLLYYLILRREVGKNDKEKIRALFLSGKIQENRFYALLENNIYRYKILELYDYYRRVFKTC